MSHKHHNKGCGCNTCKGHHESDPKDGHYVMVAVTANKAPICGDSLEDSTSCLKSDYPYDMTMADSSVPSNQSNALIAVCNAGFYAVGFWLFFPEIGATLQIASIANNTLSVRNICPDGTRSIKGNPPPGTTIPKNSKFYLVDAPACEGQSDESDAVRAALQQMTELPVPNLRAAGSSERVQIVGLVVADPNNADFERVIVRALSLFDTNGVISAPGIPQISANSNGYRKLVYRLSDSAIARLPDIEVRVGDSYDADNSYYNREIGGIPSDVNGKIWQGLETPVELINKGYSNLVNNANIYTVSGAISVEDDTPYEETVSLSSKPAIVDPDTGLNPQGGVFWAMLRVTCALRGSTAGNNTYPKILIQDKEVAVVGTAFSNPDTFTIPVQVTNTGSKDIKFKITTDDTIAIKGILKVDLLGIFQ